MSSPFDGLLLTLDQAKAYLGITDTPSTELGATFENARIDTLVGDLIAEAEGKLQSYLETTIEASEAETLVSSGKRAVRLPHYPLDPATPVLVTNETDSLEIASTMFRVNEGRGSVSFLGYVGVPQNKVYKVVSSGGLEFLPNWEQSAKLDLQGSIRDYVAWRYNNREPGIKRQSEGAGLSKEFEEGELPSRIRDVWINYRPILG